MVKVSVVMSVFNGEQFIDAAVQSILNQSERMFEFIITDDASVDSSWEKLKVFEEMDSRIKLIKNDKNRGLAWSLNNMVAMAKGQYIMRMDADDVSEANRLRKQLEVFETNCEVDLVYTGTNLIDCNGDFICYSWRPNKCVVLNSLPQMNYIPHPSVMFKKKAILELGGYNEMFKTGQDTELWVRMRDKQKKFYYLKERLLQYRLNPLSVRKTDDEYWYTVANYCIWNRNRLRAITYVSKLKFEHKLKILFKCMIPYGYYSRKQQNR